MISFLPWKTIPETDFTKEVKFIFGNPPAEQELENWASYPEDLEIRLDLKYNGNLEKAWSCFYGNENCGIVLAWTADKKFSGCSPVYKYAFEEEKTISCKIPKGWSLTDLNVQCIIITEISEDNSEWMRPPGSIISTIGVVDKVKLGSGSLFPVQEREGEGKTLIKWDFSSLDDLEFNLSENVTIYVDRNHPMHPAKMNCIEADSYLMLLILQAFARKAFTPGIFETIIHYKENGIKWEKDSLGAAFNFILKEISTKIEYKLNDDMKEVYLDSPERIDTAIDNIFSEHLINL